MVSGLLHCTLQPGTLWYTVNSKSSFGQCASTVWVLSTPPPPMLGNCMLQMFIMSEWYWEPVGHSEPYLLNLPALIVITMESLSLS